MLRKELLGGLVFGLIFTGQVQAQDNPNKTENLNFVGEQFAVMNVITADTLGSVKKHKSTIKITPEIGPTFGTSYERVYSNTRDISNFGFKTSMSNINLEGEYGVGENYSKRVLTFSSGDELKISTKVLSVGRETPYISQSGLSFKDGNNSYGIDLKLDNLGTITQTNLKYDYDLGDGKLGINLNRVFDSQSQTEVFVPFSYSFNNINFKAGTGYKKSKENRERRVNFSLNLQF